MEVTPRLPEELISEIFLYTDIHTCAIFQRKYEYLKLNYGGICKWSCIVKTGNLLLLKRHFSLSTKGYRSSFLINFASKNGNLEMVKWLNTNRIVNRRKKFTVDALYHAKTFEILLYIYNNGYVDGQDKDDMKRWNNRVTSKIMNTFYMLPIHDDLYMDIRSHDKLFVIDFLYRNEICCLDRIPGFLTWKRNKMCYMDCCEYRCRAFNKNNTQCSRNRFGKFLVFYCDKHGRAAIHNEAAKIKE